VGGNQWKRGGKKEREGEYFRRTFIYIHIYMYENNAVKSTKNLKRREERR
jgi:hypothetical protein